MTNSLAPFLISRIAESSPPSFVLNYRLIEPMRRQIARLNFEGRLKAVAEEKENHAQAIDFGLWRVTVSYGLPQFGLAENPPGNPEPVGRALIAELGTDEFLVAGFFCRVDFHLSSTAGKQRLFLKVEEGSYKEGLFTPLRIWTGDQTDYGLNFTSAPQVLRVSLTTY